MPATYTLRKIVKSNQSINYLNIGWVAESQVAEDSWLMSKQMLTNFATNQHDDLVFKQPFLIQRAKIVRPFNHVVGKPLSEAVKYDYMGAAEFEYGALPKSLRQVEAQFMMYKLYKIPEIEATLNGKSYPLRVFANFDSEVEKEQYVGFIKSMVSKRDYYLKESTHLQLASDGTLSIPERTDFWWDINNGIFFSFDKQFMSRLDSHLKASFQKMAVQS